MLLRRRRRVGIVGGRVELEDEPDVAGAEHGFGGGEEGVFEGVDAAEAAGESVG